MGTLPAKLPHWRRSWRLLLAALVLLGAGTLALDAMRGRPHRARLADVTPIPSAPQFAPDMPLQGIFANAASDGKSDDAQVLPTGPNAPASLPGGYGDGGFIGLADGSDAQSLREFATANDSFATPRESAPFRFATFDVSGGGGFGASGSGGGGGAAGFAGGGGGGGAGGFAGGGVGGSSGGSDSGSNADSGAPASGGSSVGPIGNGGGLNGPSVPPESSGNSGQSGPSGSGQGGASGGQNQILMPVTTVPEPATWLALVTGFGLVGIVLRARRGATRKRLA